MADKVTQTVIMVGGKGTRLRPLTETCPKPILPVLDKPCLMYLIENIASAGIDEIILACGYRSDQLVDTIGDGSNLGIKITYSFEDEPLGTAGAIKMIEDDLHDTFVAINGDVFSRIDVSEVVREHFSSGAAVTISLTEVENPCEYGIARVEDDGRISEFKEKPKPEEVFSNLINAGIYVVQKEVLKYVPGSGQYDFSKELVPDLMEKSYRIQGYRYKGPWLDVGRPSDLIGANLMVADWNPITPNSREELSGSSCDGPFYLGDKSVMKNTISSSSTIHKDCNVEDSDLSGSLIMEGCIVRSSKLVNSILGKRCKVMPGSVVEDSVIGYDEIIPENTRIIRNEVMN